MVLLAAVLSLLAQLTGLGAVTGPVVLVESPSALATEVCAVPVRSVCMNTLLQGHQAAISFSFQSFKS